MTQEKFTELMNIDLGDSEEFENSRIFKGLEIIRKYIPDADIEAAEHDIIYCCGIEDIVNAGITENDVKTLNAYGWHISEDALAHFA